MSETTDLHFPRHDVRLAIIPREHRIGLLIAEETANEINRSRTNLGNIRAKVKSLVRQEFRLTACCSCAQLWSI